MGSSLFKSPLLVESVKAAGMGVLTWQQNSFEINSGSEKDKGNFYFFNTQLASLILCNCNCMFAFSEAKNKSLHSRIKCRRQILASVQTLYFYKFQRIFVVGS